MTLHEAVLIGAAVCDLQLDSQLLSPPGWLASLWAFSVINKPSAPPSSQPGPLYSLSSLPQRLGSGLAATPGRSRPRAPSPPASLARPAAPLHSSPPLLPLQLLIVFHRGRWGSGATPGNPQVALAKWKLFLMSRKVPDKAGRKKPPTEEADDGRRGAEPQRRGRALCGRG